MPQGTNPCTTAPETRVPTEPMLCNKGSRGSEMPVLRKEE